MGHKQVDSQYRGCMRLTSFEHVFLDMDGVLTDFIGSVLRLQQQAHLLSNWPKGHRDVHSLMGISKSAFWRIVDSQGSDFWATLPEFEWSKQLVAMVRQYAPMTILTSPSMSPSCLEGKVRWLYNYFTVDQGKLFTDFMIGHNKELLAAPGRVLIDDTERKVTSFQDAGGMAILFPQPWNANFAIADRLGYVRAQLGLLAEVVLADDHGQFSSSTLSRVSRAIVGEPFQLCEFLALGSECVVFRLVDGNILKISPHQSSLPDANKFSLPTIDQGYIKTDDCEMLWFIQPYVSTPIDPAHLAVFLDALRGAGLRMIDPSPHNLGYYEGHIKILDPWSVVSSSADL